MPCATKVWEGFFSVLCFLSCVTELVTYGGVEETVFLTSGGDVIIEVDFGIDDISVGDQLGDSELFMFIPSSVFFPIEPFP